MTRFYLLGPTDSPSTRAKKPRFESAEHEYIGNRVALRFDAQTIQGADFAYWIVGVGSTLTYGLIVALAGDFYGNYTNLVGDVEQISDKWISDPESSIALGVKLAGTLSNNTEKYLAYVLETMKKEEDEVRARIAGGEDVAQIYASFGDKYDKEYNSDTRPIYSPIGAYAWIALCNWDHFGEDAYSAYSAVHTAALRKAKEAHDAGPSQADKILVEAYFLEAYAQHFLTDLFSSGHMRTPRRVLHRNLLGDDPDDGVEPYPADRCAQMMHDEDCANGLWVRNARGDAWATYGDKQLWSGKSNQNMLQAVKAAQAGVDEVRNTRDTGVVPAAKDFAALQLTPILDGLDLSNYCPLFKLQAGSSTQVLYRTNIDNRSEFTFSSMPSSPGYGDWTSMLAKVAASGEKKNMYPFTEEFLSQTTFVHLREAPVAGSLFNNYYGPLDSGAYGSAWNMTTQFNPRYTTTQSPVEWVHAASVGPSVLSLVGRAKVSQGWHYYHLGIEGGLPRWSEYASVEDSNLRHVLYGNFDSSGATGKIGMIRYFEDDDSVSGLARFDSWVIDRSFTKAPTKAGQESRISWQRSCMISHQMDPADSFLTVIFFALCREWYFITWSNDYSNQHFISVDTDALPSEYTLWDTELLSVDWPSAPTRCLIVIGYGASGPIIAVVRPRRVSETTIEMQMIKTAVNIVAGESTATPAAYLTWFFAEAKLVTVRLSPDNSIIVIATPLHDETPVPVFSHIDLKPGQGSLLTAPFMTPIRTAQTSYTYPLVNGSQVAETTDAAIIMFFNNYGILGARVLAPVTKGSMDYELKGQTPAISGQPSKALGTTTWGARAKQAIGIFPKI